MSDTNFTAVIDHLRNAARSHAERQAMVGPDAITYAAFYQRVRQWAALLTRAGLCQGERVAIWAPKSGSFVTAIYASMEAGGTYVPLDGSQPVERARRILAGAEPAVLITDCAHFDALYNTIPPSLRLVLLLDGVSDVSTPLSGLQLRSVASLNHEAAADAMLPVPAAPEDIAAILFTSGSTGQPKGVQISYRNLDTFIGWAVAEFGLVPHDVLTNHAGFHFDLSTFDLFAAAAVGAAVWIIREDEQRDIGALSRGLLVHGATTLYCVPSLLTMMAASNALTPDATARLKRVLFAGEVFPIKHLRTLAGQLPASCALYNLYGPTETNVCTFHRVRPGDLERTKPVALGQPLPGQEALVLNSEGVPITSDGEPGELVITGSCVTPGYFRRDDPVNGRNHKIHSHATGDLVAWEAGLLCYYGRKDRMLKINGNRVELGEIEAALLGLSAVHETAVIGVITESSQTLVAFFSLQPGAAKPGAIAIKQHCSTLLPRYMIPNIVRHIDALPKSANGKIDYIALREIAEAAVCRPVTAAAE